MHHYYICFLSFSRTHMFRSSHSTIIRVLDIKEYNKSQSAYPSKKQFLKSVMLF
jgi:hypothetical protein